MINKLMGDFTKVFVIVVVMVAAIAFFNSVSAADPDMLQDICVADLKSDIIVNGFPCKANASAEDFAFSGLAEPGLTNNQLGSLVTTANVMQVPGLNTLGVSMARIDFAPGGVNPPHTHPRGSEMIFVLAGEKLTVGFVTTANVLFAQTLKMGDTFVFPRGLVHFQVNNGKVPAAVISAFNSQLPGTQVIANSLFAAMPPIPDDVLARAFRIDIEEVEEIKAKFAPKKV